MFTLEYLISMGGRLSIFQQISTKNVLIPCADFLPSKFFPYHMLIRYSRVCTHKKSFSQCLYYVLKLSRWKHKTEVITLCCIEAFYWISDQEKKESLLCRRSPSVYNTLNIMKVLTKNKQNLPTQTTLILHESVVLLPFS